MHRFLKGPEDDVILGIQRNAIIPFMERLTKSEMNLHTHVVGASGFGKTVLISPAATSKSPTRGRVKFLHLSAVTRRSDDYSLDPRLASREAASFSRQLFPSNFNR